MKGILWDIQPTFDEKYTNQTELTPTTVEEIRKLRKPPKYNGIYLIIQIILFMTIGILRAFVAGIYALIVGGLYMILVTFWRSFGCPEKFRNFLMMMWSSGARVFLFLIGFVNIRFHGECDSESRFVVSNHTCFFDSWLFLPFYPKPLEKKEIFNLPLIRDMCEVFGGIPVDRTKACGLTKELLRNAEDPNNPQIFCMPEGATTNGEYMFRFHLGAFLSDLPVQPAAIRYTLWGTNRKISTISFFQNHPRQWIAFLGIPFITVDIFFLDVMSIKVDAENDPRVFADKVSLAIGNRLGCKVLNLTTSTIFKAKQE